MLNQPVMVHGTELETNVKLWIAQILNSFVLNA